MEYCEGKYGIPSCRLLELRRNGDPDATPDNGEVHYWEFWLWHMDGNNIRLPIPFEGEVDARAYWVAMGDMNRPRVRFFFKPEVLMEHLTKEQKYSKKRAREQVELQAEEMRLHRLYWDEYGARFKHYLTLTGRGDLLQHAHQVVEDS